MRGVTAGRESKFRVFCGEFGGGRHSRDRGGERRREGGEGRGGRRPRGRQGRSLCGRGAVGGRMG